jgi:hypothetical protein
MPANVVSKINASHYKWGGSAGIACDGWHLVRTPELSIIEEIIAASLGGRNEISTEALIDEKAIFQWWEAGSSADFHSGP